MPSRYFWTARTVSPACRGQCDGERLSVWSSETNEKMFSKGEKSESIIGVRLLDLRHDAMQNDY